MRLYALCLWVSTWLGESVQACCMSFSNFPKGIQPSIYHNLPDHHNFIWSQEGSYWLSPWFSLGNLWLFWHFSCISGISFLLIILHQDLHCFLTVYVKMHGIFYYHFRIISALSGRQSIQAELQHSSSLCPAFLLGTNSSTDAPEQKAGTFFFFPRVTLLLCEMVLGKGSISCSFQPSFPRIEKLFENIIVKNFLDALKVINLQMQEGQ